MLRRQHNRGHTNRFSIFISDGQLAFGIGTQGRFRAILAHFSQPPQNSMGIVNRCRHELWRLIRGKPEHNPLVARAFVLVRSRVDALRDMRRLLMQQVCNLTGSVVELVLLIPDVFDAGARDILDAAHVIVQFFSVGKPNLTTDHHAVRRGKGFCGDPRLGFFRQKGIQHRI